MIYITLFWTFLKIGAFTFGGGYAMLPLIQSEVAAHKWMSGAELVNFVAVSESTPGPFAVNIATYVGAETGGFFGAVCATAGVVLPSFLIILIVAGCFEKFKNSRTVSGCMNGLRPAVVGLIAAAVMSVGQTVFLPWSGLTSFAALAGIFLLSLTLVFKKLHPIAVMIISAILGIALGYAGVFYTNP